MKFEPVIGLEIHIQLNTKTKMFCSSPNLTDGVAPNTNICEICTGQPGTLPVANKEAIEKAIRLGLALNCQIAEHTKFDRKHYFYPDLPKGYQISQFDQPICGKGEVEFVIDGETRKIRITRAHLEEDAGKLIHPTGANYSLVDLNRAGVPLVEIVTEPDFKTPIEARLFLQQLRTLARYLNVSDADMEKGHLRCDANVSLRPIGSDQLPDYKIEIKNMNSFRAVEEALHFEIERQTEELEAGKKLTKQTRGWSDTKKQTLAQRDKEGSDDYRYFPEPDLPTLRLTPEFIESIRKSMPELPEARRRRFEAEFGLPSELANQLIEAQSLGDYFEGIVSDLKAWFVAEKIGDTEALSDQIKEATNWCTGIFTELLNESQIQPEESKISAENFAELLKMIHKNEISKTAAKQVFIEMFKTGGDPSEIVADKGLKQVSDTGELETIVDKILLENPNVVADVKAGKDRAMGFLVGKVMSETKGKANPKMVNEILRKMIQ